MPFCEKIVASTGYYRCIGPAGALTGLASVLAVGVSVIYYRCGEGHGWAVLIDTGQLLRACELIHRLIVR